MATKLALQVFERNDPRVTITASRDGGLIDLTGLGIEVHVKAKAADLDATGTVLTLAAGDVTVTDAAAGQFEVLIPASVLSSPGKRFYRADLLDGTLRHTVLYGDLTIVDV